MMVTFSRSLPLASLGEVSQGVLVDIVRINQTPRADPRGQADGESASAGADLSDDHAGFEADRVHDFPGRLGPVHRLFQGSAIFSWPAEVRA